MESPTYPLRVNLILSLLSGKPLKVRNIRKDDPEPGLKGNKPKISCPLLFYYRDKTKIYHSLLDYEVNLLKLIDSITNGTRTDINETGMGVPNSIKKCETSFFREIKYFKIKINRVVIFIFKILNEFSHIQN